MPFRSNFFGEKYAQPGTSIDEINEVLIDKYGDAPTIFGARFDEIEPDENFKVGGEILFNGLEDDDETYVENMNFDGFETFEEAKNWLIADLGIDEDNIEVEG